MPRQISETIIGRLHGSSWVSILLFVVVAVLPGVATAQSELVERAFGELQAERYEEALDLLDRAKTKVANEEGAARVTYYRAFALEKLGQCEAAELGYRRVLDAASAKKLQSYAREALAGFDDRCVAAPPRAVEQAEISRGSGRVGWKVLGWTTMILGGLTLAAIPVKSSLENDITGQAEPYFELQYNCVVDDGEVSGPNCDRAALEKDDAYLEYEDARATAETWTDVMLVTGASLAGVGLGTLVLVAVTRPGGSDVTVAVTPSPDGAFASATIRF